MHFFSFLFSQKRDKNPPGKKYKFLFISKAHIAKKELAPLLTP